MTSFKMVQKILMVNEKMSKKVTLAQDTQDYELHSVNAINMIYFILFNNLCSVFLSIAYLLSHYLIVISRTLISDAILRMVLS